MLTLSIETRNLCKSFGRVQVLNNLNLSVKAEEFFSLLGPSGCGKSTTLNLIAGFEKQDSGDVFIDGKSVNKVPPRKRNLSMVFQSYALFPHMTIFDNVSFGLKMEKMPNSEIKPKVGRMLDLLSLNGYEERYPRQLSGGERQRVALARALVTNPQALLLDEPLSNLDAKLRQRMRTELRKLQQTLDITTLYVTHDQMEALMLSDRIAVMCRGRIEQVSGPVDLYKRPKTTWVADFIGESNIFEARVLKDDGRPVLAIDGIEIVLPQTEELHGKKKVFVGIRSENIRILSQKEKGENIFPATIDQEAFGGHLMKFVLYIGDLAMTASAHYSGATGKLKSGDQIHVKLPPEDFIILEGGASEAS